MSGLRRRNQTTISKRVNIIAVNIEVNIPIANVTEKPLIGPDPKEYRHSAANSVVKLESIIVVRARLYPASIAEIGVRPKATSSRILSKIKTFASTAIPIVKTIPAIPGSVKVACSTDNAPTIKTMLKNRAILAKTPKRP